MDVRQERRPEAAAGVNGGENEDASLVRLRAASRRLASADEIVDRALSVSSEHFLRAAKQRGGQ
jgi:hypothetical protein